MRDSETGITTMPTTKSPINKNFDFKQKTDPDDPKHIR